MPTAFNPQTGEMLILGDDGQWTKPPMAQNDKGEKLFLDGDAWKPLPQPARDPNVRPSYSALSAGRPYAENPALRAGQKVMDYTEGLGRQVTNAATLGYGDEIGAGATGLMEMVKNLINGQPADFSAPYNAALAEQRTGTKDFAKANPVAATAGSIFGGIGAMAPGAGASATAATAIKPGLLKTMGKSALVGGGYGAAAGFGAGEGGLENRAGNAAYGGATGAAVGAAIPAVVEGGRLAIQKIANAFGWRDPANVASQKIMRAFERDGIPPQEAIKRLDDWQKSGGDRAMLADIGGENVKGLARSAASAPGPGKELAVTNIRARQEGQGARLSTEINKRLKPDEFYAAEDQFLARLKDNASDAYGAFRKEVPQLWSKDLSGLFERPTMQKALGSAALNAADEGRVFGIVRHGGGQFGAAERGAGGKIQALTPEGVDDVKRALDGIIQSEGQNPITLALNNRGRIVTNLKNDFLKAVESADPKGLYKAARQQYAGDLEVVTALRDGREFAKLDAEEIAKRVKDMSFGEKDAWHSGIARALKDMIEKAPDGADATKRIFGNKLIRDKLEAAFDSPKAFAQFRQMVEREAKMFDVSRLSPRSGSQTEPRMSETEDLLTAPSAVRQGLFGNFLPALGLGVNYAARRAQGITPEVSQKLVQQLLTGDTAASRGAMVGLMSQQGQGALDALRRAELSRLMSGYMGGAVGRQY